MILIDGSFGSNSNFLLGASGVFPAIKTLTFWEQITGISVAGESSFLSIDDRPVEDCEAFILVRPPRFAKATGEPAELDFRWAEWNAALAGLLYQRRKFIPNGKFLIPNMFVADNPDAFLKPFAAALRIATSAVARESGSRIWILATKGAIYSYPFNASIGLDFDFHASLFLELVEAGLDYVVLELFASGGKITLSRVHIVPPFYGPLELQRAIAQGLRGLL